MLAARILNGLTEALNSPPEAFVTVLEELKSSYYLMNKPIRARLGDGTVEGLVVDLGSEGELIVETSEGSREQLTSVDEVRVISRPRS
jgi:biotin-(acetyl-CoA carboxylase) ligase